MTQVEQMSEFVNGAQFDALGTDIRQQAGRSVSWMRWGRWSIGWGAHTHDPWVH